MSLPVENIVGPDTTVPNVPKEAPADPPKAKNPGGVGIRHLEIFLVFVGLTMAFVLRVNMSVAIVAMSNSTTANPDIEDFGWDTWTQSLILSSFFWGSVAMQLPSGQIVQMWNASKFWAGCMFVCGVVNLLIPIAARTGGWIAVCVCRIIMGICQGCVLPCIHTLLGKWVPPNERSRLGTYAYMGSQFGTVVGLLISGFMAASSAGWPSIFYLGGALTIAWSIVFFIWGADSPGQHRSIKPAEKNYIQESLNQVGDKKRPRVPWLRILTSLPVWALIVIHATQNWGYWMLLTEIPTFMSAVLLFDISSNGLISALPYLTMLLLSFPASWASDYVLKRGWVTRATARKISNSIGHWGPAIALIGLGYTTVEHTIVAVVVLVVAVGLNAGILSGYQINHVDLSPNFSGTLMAITNFFANITSILAPLLAGLILADTSDITQWRIVFYISTGIYFLGNLFFVLFGQGEVQDWNEPEVEWNAENGKTPSGQENSEHNKSDQKQ